MSFGLELDMGGRILDGAIASDLTKPVDFQNMCFFQTIGQASIEGLITLVLVVSVAVLVTDLSAYLAPWRLLLFGISLLLAFFLKFCLVYLGVLMCFFTSNGYGVVYLRQVICDVFSGLCCRFLSILFGFNALRECFRFRHPFICRPKFSLEELTDTKL